MPRILSSVIGRINKRNIHEVSYNDRLIITDYSDLENESFRKKPDEDAWQAHKDAEIKTECQV